MRPEEAAAIISTELAHGRRMALARRASPSCCSCYGLPLSTTQVVPGVEEAVAAAAELGRPGGAEGERQRGSFTRATPAACCSGSTTPTRSATPRLQIKAAVARAGHELEGLVVQPMAPTGVELIVGVVNDRSFGPVLACGAGGTTAELIKDVAVRITPVTDLDAHEMLRSLQDVPAARRLPRRTALRHRGDRGRAAARERDGRRTSGDRRARSQPADRHRRTAPSIVDARVRIEDGAAGRADAVAAGVSTLTRVAGPRGRITERRGRSTTMA